MRAEANALLEEMSRQPQLFGMDVAGIGRVIFWSGGSLWIGLAVAPGSAHAHHAIQLSLGLSGEVEFRAGAGDWRRYAAALVPPELSHAFRAPGRLVANIFCGPESALGRHLLQRFAGSGIVAPAPEEVAPHRAALARAFAEGAHDADLEALALDALHGLARFEIRAEPADRRILSAIDAIGEALDAPITLEGIARRVGLSPGRFRHLFVAETGIPFRAYVLWARLNRALELGFSGLSWTEAAHAADFADSAHLSRTCRRMYGLAPSSLRQDVSASSDSRRTA